MPASEFVGWLDFYKAKQKKEEASKGNLLAMDDEQIAQQFGVKGK